MGVLDVSSVKQFRFTMYRRAAFLFAVFVTTVLIFLFGTFVANVSIVLIEGLLRDLYESDDFLFKVQELHL